MSGPSITLGAPQSRRPPIAGFAAAGAVALLVLAGAYWAAAPSIMLWRADGLLSEAYTEIRPFAFRLPDRGYRRMAEHTNARIPPSIRKARALLAQAQGSLGGSARSALTARIHALLGRASFLEGSADEAIQQYRRALEIDPRDSQTQLELAGAYLLRAGLQNRPVDIALALEQAGAATRLHAQSAIDHFNLAVVYEAIPAPHLALDEWALCLLTETDPGWRREAEEQRVRLTALLSGLQRRAATLQSGPQAFLQEAARKPYPPEFALDVAITDWLPQRNRDQSAREALNFLARQFIERHRDPWLSDLLRRAKTQGKDSAIQALADAVRNNQTGKHEIALERAAEAEKGFQTVENRAGGFRARAERIYALQRAGQGQQCTQVAAGLYRDLNKTSYFWLKAQTWLELTSCELNQNDSGRAISEREAALSWIRATGYEGLELRTLGFLVDPGLVQANPMRLWRIVKGGLVRFWEGEFSPVRAQQFYFSAALSMRGGSFPFTTAVMAREGVRVFEGVPNQQWRALLIGLQGSMELEAGLEGDAAVSLGKAERIFATCERTETLRRYELEASLEDAAVECLRDDPREVIHRFEPLREIVSRGKSPRGYVSLEQSLAIAYLRAGEVNKSIDAFRSVLGRTDAVMDGIRDQAQRDAFLKIVDYTYREDVKLRLLGDRDSSAAFESLERFRAARIYEPKPVSMLSTVPAGAILLDVVFLPSGVAVFAADRSGVEARWVPEMQSALESLARQFTSLCGSAQSGQEEIDRAGRRIYDLLVGPFERRLESHQVLLIHADGPLQNLPWAALRDARGRPLIDRMPVVIGSALRKNIPRPAITLQQQPAAPGSRNGLLIVAEPAIGEELAAAFPPLSGSLTEARRIQSHFPYARLLSGAEATVEAVKEYLPQSAFFHFGAHGLANGGYGAMLLASKPGQSYGGVLGAQEIAGMDLHRVELVSLAACSIGAGQGAGPVNPESLVRALLDAGAHNVIAASWEIESQSAGKIFTDFYGRLARKQGVAAALRAACLRIRANPETAHPYYWAGFQLYGFPE